MGSVETISTKKKSSKILHLSSKFTKHMSTSSNNYFRPSYWHEPSSEPFLPVTFGQLIDFASEWWGDDEAFVCIHENERLSFRESKEKADKLAAGLLELGLNPGDTLAVWGGTSSAGYLTLLAAARAGIILAGIEKTGNISEVIHCLRKVEAKALLVIEFMNDKKYCEVLYEAIPELSASEPGKLRSKMFPNLKTVITSGKTLYKGTFNFEDVSKMSTSTSIENVYQLQTALQPDNGFVICFTSGSTGMSKAVPLSHHKLINVLHQFEKQNGIYHNRRRILTRVQLYGRLGLERSTLPAFLYGCTIVCASVNFNPEAFAKVVQSERCSVFADAPTAYLDIMRYVKNHGLKLDYPEVAILAGAPLTERLATDILKILPVKRILVDYGMTESGAIGSGWATRDAGNTSIVRIGNNIEVKIVDMEERMVPMGKPGELWVRGNSIMDSYLYDKERTAACKTSDGWLKTGDSCILEENGRVRLVGRIKEILIRAGRNIYPKEIENFLSTHSAITEVHAFGVPDCRQGEELCVYIEKSAEEDISEEDVKNYCRATLHDYKVPRYVRFVDEFPRSSRGKVNKRTLLEHFQNDEEYIRQNNDDNSIRM